MLIKKETRTYFGKDEDVTIISITVMQSLANDREDASIILGGVQNLSNDYEIDARYSTQLKRAF